MAGFQMGIEDGGPVEETGAIPAPPADDNSGAAPVVGPAEPAAGTAPDDNSGAAPVVGDQPPQQAPSGETPSRSGIPAPHELLRAGAKRIIGYLMGADAAPPEVAEKFAQGVQSEYPGVNADDANLLAVHKAYELGGPHAGWQMAQFNRMAYNAKQSFALAAMQGAGGKPPDPAAAANAATQASQHVLDGSNTQFTATPDGAVTATVRPAGSDRTISMQLSPQAFVRYLNVGGDGQYDKVMEQGGVEQALRSLSNTGGSASTSSTEPTESESGFGGNEPGSSPDKPATAATKGAAKEKFSETYDDDDQGGDNGAPFSQNLLDRANALFPSISQGAQRNAWMAQQMDQAAAGRRQMRVAQTRADILADAARARASGQVSAAEARAGGQVGAAQVTGQSRENAARTRGTSNEAIAKSRADAAAQAEAGKNARLTQAEQGRNYRGELTNPNQAIMKPEDIQALRERNGQNGPQQIGQQGGQHGAGSTDQRPGTKFFNGRWYTRDEYQKAFGR